MTQWQLKIDFKDFWKNDKYSFAEQIQMVYQRITNSDWWDITSAPITLGLLTDELGDSISAYLMDEIDEDALLRDFNDLWDGFYDLADIDRVWLSTVL